MKKHKLGQLLIGSGIITHNQLENALEIQKHEGGLLGMILVKLNYLTTEELSEYIKMQNNI